MKERSGDQYNVTIFWNLELASQDYSWKFNQENRYKSVNRWMLVNRASEHDSEDGNQHQM